MKSKTTLLLLFAALAASCALAGGAQAQFVAAAAADSAHAPRLADLRTDYQKAWKLKHDGRPERALQSAVQALVEIQADLAADPDATERRELVDLQSRFEGLRDVSRHDWEVQPPVEPGNEADERVLNAPAVEELKPQFNADVYRWIEFFTGNGRSQFERWLKRSGRYMSLFRSILQREGLPPDLVHLVFVESGFNLNARSVSHAVGPWQFVRSSGRLFGLDVNQWVDERKDPEKSTVAAARYLKHLYSIFGDWPLALASYNAGEGTVLRAIKAQGTTNYWDLKLPRQTEDYVPQFMAVLAISRDPEKYGFGDVELDDPMQFDEVALKGAVDLRSVARLADCSLEEIKLLNPAVVRHALPGKDGITTVRVPRGKGEAIATRIQEGASLPQTDLTIRHRVQSGETLQSIAIQYHVSAQALARANGVGRKRPLRRGMVLTVPATLDDTPLLVDASDPRASTSYVPSRQIRTPAQLSGLSTAEGRTTHVVHRGETLASIADQYDCTPSDILRWNHLRTNYLRRGTRLKIRSSAADTASVAAAAADSAQIAELRAPTKRRSSSRHRSSGAVMDGSGMVVVQSGDTLGLIARRHGVSVSELMRINGLTTSRVRAGQRLRLPAG